MNINEAKIRDNIDKISELVEGRRIGEIPKNELEDALMICLETIDDCMIFISLLQSSLEDLREITR